MSRKLSNCKKVRRAGAYLKSMSSKTFLLGLSFFGAAVKGPCMEDLLGSLLLTTVKRNGPRISPRGVEIPELNAALMSALGSVFWFVLRPSFSF